MIRKKIFIGSSSEEIGLANAAKAILDKDFDVTIWNESVWDNSVFKINNNFLNDLLRASLQFDFSLLIGTTDDQVEYRGNTVMQPRDNVLFELGLFIGRLGLSKCAFVIDKELKVLSDISGITLARFKKDDVPSFVTAINQISELFKNQIDADINFFPSSTLASGYFENLLSPTCKYLIQNGGFEIDGTKYIDYAIQVIIPNRLSADVNLQFEQLKKGFSTKNVSFNYAGRPRHINLETEIKDGKLIFIDFPTTLSGINYAISNLLPNDFNTMSADYEAIINRELERFIYTLKQLALRNGFDSIIEIKKQDS
ncbi:CBASS system CD-NTase-associated NAD(+) hydrolase Cap12 [Flavobacterium humi]|uniref:CD-NTase-associated protein 12 n=1 Tax=Flavobacterium humi TaxID=2562683 RepID=A0A4Z0L606_9FLAO|nr:STING domain-containing protein [Flavobacterium humi]TGD56542.1 DNA-binding protein [Flavobacterium humi]